MTNTADQPIAALRSGHDSLVALVHTLSPEQIAGRSGAAEWSVAQVLSHLGSGAEIGLAALNASLHGAEKPAEGFNRSVWDRWDAMTPPDQAHHFMMSNEKLVRAYEKLDDATRTNGTVDLGFLPAPVDVATAASFRLTEFALHSWDVAVTFDPDATLAPEAVEPLLTTVPLLIGWIGKPADVLGGHGVAVTVRTSDPTRDFGLEITDKVGLVDSPDDADAELVLPAESWLRLATGRLQPTHTPAGVTVNGDITLEKLRQIFPGY
ncbi:TIGR03083 family protein [Nakamurella panacisegetis]|uniref:TIGR03083 family protein n=1 Tax=Nakamurella panacisegetis TaxID=1090615 RepID=A0A1H0IB55_9ACTN|nr:maleylpyruvate isomerase family mycothiol-dependent enzyme [Nakamurella panacisegetis]SDO28595.1 TIGR03083 family protein [Nakamurella panacisegetis]